MVPAAPQQCGPLGPGGGTTPEETVTDVAARQASSLAGGMVQLTASVAGPIATTGAGAAAGAAMGGAVASEMAGAACSGIPLVGGIIAPAVQAIAGAHGTALGAVVGATAAQSLPPLGDVMRAASESDLAEAMRRSCSRRSSRSQTPATTVPRRLTPPRPQLKILSNDDPTSSSATAIANPTTTTTTPQQAALPSTDSSWNV